jgi:arsenite-transporting ATPase
VRVLFLCALVQTTTSCSLAVQLSKARESVLLVSTDPAHNLSDAFGKKFNKNATLVQGFPNLYAMEIDPTIEVESGDVLDAGSAGVVAELASSIPGIDEAMSFSVLMQEVSATNYSVIVFDTAPTGHTLRLLSFPSVLEKAFEKFMAVKSKFAGLFSQVSGMVGQEKEGQIVDKLTRARETIELINAQFKDPELTTFVCVCIPVRHKHTCTEHVCSRVCVRHCRYRLHGLLMNLRCLVRCRWPLFQEFLSLFETERLVQELAKYEIDTHNIVVNQVLYPEEQVGSSAGHASCGKCLARRRMQAKYLDQIQSLYDDFHVTHMPLLDEEVRGVEAIEAFSKNLLRHAIAPPPPPPAAAAKAATPLAASAQ